VNLDEGKMDKQQQQFLQLSNVDEHNYALKMTMLTNDPLIAENQGKLQKKDLINIGKSIKNKNFEFIINFSN
jgi:ATP:corrinoid adenosyltransferase